MIYLILGILALIYLCGCSTWEHMTNSDIQKKQEHHKTATTWDSVHKKKDSEPVENQLKGPKTSVLSDEEQKEKEKNAPKAVETKGVDYPQVYGPDITLVPGYKDSSQSHSQADFIPAAEFPKGPKAPEPFLGNFSKIMK
jgi:hypothetical protein